MELKSIGKYTILEKIGQGAMGEVYKALDPVLHRHVAIKTMADAIGQDPELRERFLREARSAARLGHPNIVTLYDFGEDQGRVYMAMELLTGTDLKDMIKLGGLELEEKLELMEQVCDALATAHAADVIHRDLKPANIHVQPNRQVKIVDFGLARLGASEMTKTGMVMGTPNYMSPEQVRGDKADARSDVFALGAVFYELLGNHKAFDATSLHAVFFQVLEHEPKPVRDWNADLPEVVVPFLKKALAKDPAKRYQNAGEMRQALRIVRRAMMGEIDDQQALDQLNGVAVSTGDSGAWGSRVQGSAALDPARRSGRIPQPRTMPGAEKTHPSAATAAPSGALPKVALVGGGIAAVAVVAVGAVLWLRSGSPPATPAPPPAGNTGVELVTRQLVTTKVELAQTKLDVKDFKGAALEAQQALELDKGNADARRVLDQAQGKLKELEDAAQQARAAVRGGDLDTASKSLEQVLAIDPQHSVAAELSKQLGSRFRGQAEGARGEMKRSQAAAVQAKASSERGFAEAQGLGRDAEALFKRGDFTLAAQKFLDSRDNFERARRAALERQRPPTPAPHQAALPTPVPTAPPTAIAQQPPPSPVAVATPAANTADEQAAVLSVIADYERAIEQKDLGLYRRIWPTLSSAEAKRLQAAFQATEGHDVRIAVSSVQVDGARATVRLARSDTIKGKPIPSMSQTVSLVKQGEAWTIRAIGQ